MTIHFQKNLAGLKLFFEVRAPFLKTEVTFSNFKQSENLLFSKDSLKKFHINCAKRFLFPLIILTRISLSWIAFEESNISISSRACSFETKLKGNLDVFSCSEAIVRILEGFLYFTVAFWVTWSMLSVKGLQLS